MTREARARERAVVHMGILPGSGSVAVLTGITAANVGRRFAGGGNVVVAKVAGPRHRRVIHRGVQPARSRVTVIAGVGARDVGRALPRG